MKAGTTAILKGCTVIAFFSAVLFAFANSYFYAWPAGDENWHFAYSKRFVEQGVIERESVHNYNSTTPFVVLNVALDQAANKLGLTSGFDKVAARIPAVGWYVLLLVLSYVCTRLLLRDADPARARIAACWTTLFTSLDQSLLGHGSHIGSDIPFAAATLLFLAALDLYRRNPGLKTASVLGLVLGLAFNLKYSTTFLVIFAAAFITFVQVRSFRSAAASALQCCGRLALHLAVAAVLVTVIVDAAYGFKAVGLTFASKEWYAAPFKLLAGLIPNLPLPWPLPFVAGFDHQLAAERTWSWNSILLGREYPNGVWFYFPLVWLVKTPLALLAAVFLGGALAVVHFAELRRNSGIVLTFALFAFFLFYFCFVFRTQVGIRYTLMCLPLAYLLLGYVLSVGLRPTEQSVLAVFVFVGTLLEAVPYFGNTMSFTNRIVADKARAHEWITDSNVDWFHNYERAKAAATQKLGRYVFNPPHIVVGNNLFSINKLSGVMRNFQQYSWIRNNLVPNGHFGYTLVWYDIDQKTFERFLKEARTIAVPKGASDICPPDRVYRPLENGSSAEFGGSWKDPKLYTACLKVTEPTDIELTVNTGYGAFGSYPWEMNCAGDEAGAGESLWFRLPPGVHPICARIMVPAQAKWTIHRGKAELSLRNQ